jgi:hypothetical protein
MLEIEIEFRSDRNILNNIAKRITDRTNETSLETANAILQDIQESWSSSSPSNPGETPAVVTGELSDSAIILDESSGILSKYKIVFKAKHAILLEYGTGKMAARPFVKPAVLRNRGLFKKRFRVK